MKTTILGGLALALIFAAAPVMAQADAHAGGHCAGGSHGPTHMALEHRAELGLNAQQVARLEALDDSMKALHGAGMAQMHAAHHAPAAQAHAGHGEDHAHAAHAAQSGAHAQHGAMHASMQRIHQQVAAVLTEEQRTRLHALHARHQGGMQGCCGDCCKDGRCDQAACREHCGEEAAACCERCCKDGRCDEAACRECCEAMGGEHASAGGHGGHAGHTQR